MTTDIFKNEAFKELGRGLNKLLTSGCVPKNVKYTLKNKAELASLNVRQQIFNDFIKEITMDYMETFDELLLTHDQMEEVMNIVSGLKGRNDFKVALFCVISGR